MWDQRWKLSLLEITGDNKAGCTINPGSNEQSRDDKLDFQDDIIGCRYYKLYVIGSLDSFCSLDMTVVTKLEGGVDDM